MEQVKLGAGFKMQYRRPFGVEVYKSYEAKAVFYFCFLTIIKRQWVGQVAVDSEVMDGPPALNQDLRPKHLLLPSRRDVGSLPRRAQNVVRSIGNDDHPRRQCARAPYKRRDVYAK